jgi:hypothetical protein
MRNEWFTRQRINSSPNARTEKQSQADPEVFAEVFAFIRDPEVSYWKKELGLNDERVFFSNSADKIIQKQLVLPG